MDNSDSIFDPMLSRQYSQCFASEEREEGFNHLIESRSLLYLLNQPDKHYDAQPLAFSYINQWLAQVQKVHGVSFSKHYSEERLLALQGSKIEPLAQEYWTQTNQAECVKQAAEILLTQPCWLQNISQSAFCQDKTSIQLTLLYLQVSQASQETPNLRALFQSVLLATDINIVGHYDVLPAMLDFSTIQCVLAYFPRVFLPEILGFTLAYCQTSTVIEICFPEHQLSPLYFDARHEQLKKQIVALLDCTVGYLNFFPKEQQYLWQRIQTGFWLYQLQIQRCREQFSNALEKTLTADQSVTRLFQTKVAAAIGHHQKIKLQGVSLDKWLSGMPGNQQAFLYALQQSNYINRNKPLDSPLLKLFDFKGPMFGVLSKSELMVLKNWLLAEINPPAINFDKEAVDATTSKILSANSNLSNKYTNLTNRKLYYYLVNSDLFPDVLAVSERKVSRLLRLCSFLNPAPFKHYSDDQFDTYIENSYQQEMKAYQPLQGQPKISKEAYIWGLEQIAPMILIDGCWLQYSQALQDIYPEICEILSTIYCDEIGNGQLEQNHPYIFQQLLDSLSIKLPPLLSSEFINHSKFISSAFDLPVYMLSLSHFPVLYLPELLGLNMAIELSGLGQGYLKLVDDWKYWGIDPTIAQIHISIDNYASGHTFLAKKAIQIYLNQVLQNTGDSRIRDNHWQRIYSGYASLRFVATRLKLELPVRYLIYKFKPK